MPPAERFWRQPASSIDVPINTRVMDWVDFFMGSHGRASAGAPGVAGSSAELSLCSPIAPSPKAYRTTNKERLHPYRDAAALGHAFTSSLPCPHHQGAGHTARQLIVGRHLVVQLVQRFLRAGAAPPVRWLAGTALWPSRTGRALPQTVSTVRRLAPVRGRFRLAPCSPRKPPALPSSCRACAWMVFSCLHHRRFRWTHSGYDTL